MSPGEIYMADFESAGRRPVIVGSREDLNRGRYVLVVVCTSARFNSRKMLPNCVPFLDGEFGFTADCVAQCENVVSIEKSDIIDLDDGPIGTLDAIKLRDVIKSIGYVMESDCEPE
jgi:mRNA-degrading endonuclease toxin of MazEF toxin-antitoxin module